MHMTTDRGAYADHRSVMLAAVGGLRAQGPDAAAAQMAVDGVLDTKTSSQVFPKWPPDQAPTNAIGLPPQGTSSHNMVLLGFQVCPAIPTVGAEACELDEYGFLNWDPICNIISEANNQWSSKVSPCAILINCQKYNMLLVDVLEIIFAWEASVNWLYMGIDPPFSAFSEILDEIVLNCFRWCRGVRVRGEQGGHQGADGSVPATTEVSTELAAPMALDASHGVVAIDATNLTMSAPTSYSTTCFNHAIDVPSAAYLPSSNTSVSWLPEAASELFPVSAAAPATTEISPVPSLQLFAVLKPDTPTPAFELGMTPGPTLTTAPLDGILSNPTGLGDELSRKQFSRLLGACQAFNGMPCPGFATGEAEQRPAPWPSWRRYGSGVLSDLEQGQRARCTKHGVVEKKPWPPPSLFLNDALLPSKMPPPQGSNIATEPEVLHLFGESYATYPCHRTSIELHTPSFLTENVSPTPAMMWCFYCGFSCTENPWKSLQYVRPISSVMLAPGEKDKSIISTLGQPRGVLYHILMDTSEGLSTGKELIEVIMPICFQSWELSPLLQQQVADKMLKLPWDPGVHGFIVEGRKFLVPNNQLGQISNMALVAIDIWATLKFTDWKFLRCEEFKGSGYSAGEYDLIQSCNYGAHKDWNCRELTHHNVSVLSGDSHVWQLRFSAELLISYSQCTQEWANIIEEQVKCAAVLLNYLAATHHRGENFARYLCTTCELVPGMQPLLVVWFTWVLRICAKLRKEKSGWSCELNHCGIVAYELLDQEEVILEKILEWSICDLTSRGIPFGRGKKLQPTSVLGLRQPWSPPLCLSCCRVTTRLLDQMFGPADNPCYHKNHLAMLSMHNGVEFSKDLPLTDETNFKLHYQEPWDLKSSTSRCAWSESNNSKNSSCISTKMNFQCCTLLHMPSAKLNLQEFAYENGFMWQWDPGILKPTHDKFAATSEPKEITIPVAAEINTNRHQPLSVNWVQQGGFADYSELLRLFLKVENVKELKTFHVLELMIFVYKLAKYFRCKVCFGFAISVSTRASMVAGITYKIMRVFATNICCTLLGGAEAQNRTVHNKFFVSSAGDVDGMTSAANAALQECRYCSNWIRFFDHSMIVVYKGEIP